jgi:hypothetical protein
MEMKHSDVPIGAISKLVDYLYHDEEMHYMGERDHIFRSVKRVAEWLDNLHDEERAEKWAPHYTGARARVRLSRNAEGRRRWHHD